MKSLPPSISMVTPSYNQGSFLEQTVQSVITQQYEHVEYVIVDGSSTDKTIEILSRYNGHERIRRIISEPDKGQTDALIKGFDLCSGDIFGWLNADDFLASDALSTVAKHFQNDPEMDVLVGNVACVDHSGNEIGLWPRRKMSNSQWLSMPQGIPQPATFFKSSKFKAVGGLDASLEYSMDYDLFMRFGLAGFNFRYIDDILACFRLHDASKTIALPHRLWKEEFKVFRKNGGPLLSRFYYWKIRGIVSTIVRSLAQKQRKW